MVKKETDEFEVSEFNMCLCVHTVEWMGFGSQRRTSGCLKPQAPTEVASGRDILRKVS